MAPVGSALAQQSGAPYGGIQATPKYAWEAGLHGGHFFSAGDLDFTPSYAFGFHFRRALDYVFSIRVDAMYGMAQGDSQDGGFRYEDELYDYKTTYANMSFQLLMTINNLKWDTPKRKVNIYGLIGGGPVYTKTSVKSKEQNKWNEYDDIEIAGRGTGNWVPSVEVGAGLAFRVTDNFNIGIEHKGATIFGKRTDLIDAFDNRWRDVLNYTNIRLNFNLRNKGALAEPLYWINPLDVVLTDISELKQRPVLDLTDTDKDGVIDMLDQDPNTPAGAAVDTRGIPLDSDDDGIADYLDQEPFSPPNVSVDSRGVAQNQQQGISEQQVETMIQNALQGSQSASLVDWFLPMIHFNIDSYKIRYADYGNLSNVASVLEKNPKMKLVVSGYTDQTASDDYNETLSYRRAMATIDHLVNNHGVDRNRLLLQYGGEQENLVPSSGSSLMNRRVEFRLATPDDTEMAPPKSLDGQFSGNKEGY